MKSWRVSSSLAAFSSLLLLQGAAGWDSGAPSPSAGWKPGNMWTLAVESYPRDGVKPDKAAGGAAPVPHYTLHALVTGAHKVGGADCWRVCFVPDKDVPPRLAERWYVSVDRATGWPRNYRKGKGKDLLSIDFAATPPEGPRFFTNAPAGIPIEVFPLVNNGPTGGAEPREALTVRRAVDGKDITLEATLEVAGVEEVRVRQHWVEGEKWWRRYERYVKGSKVLSARLTGVPAAAEGKTAKGDPYYLRRDPKLQVRVDVRGLNPAVPALLDHLHARTGLTLALHPDLEGHRPQLGSVQLAGARAFTVMEMLAEQQMEGGHWDKVADGYQLVGRSKAIRRAPRAAEDKAAEAATHAAMTPWLAGSAAFFGITSLALLGVFLRRRASVKGAP